MSTDIPERLETLIVPGRWPSPVARPHVKALALLLVVAVAFVGSWAIGGDAFLLAFGVSFAVMTASLPAVALSPLVYGVRGRVRVEAHDRMLSFPGTPVERPLYTVVAVLGVLFH